jgi:hypothetical protein
MHPLLPPLLLTLAAIAQDDADTTPAEPAASGEVRDEDAEKERVQSALLELLATPPSSGAFTGEGWQDVGGLMMATDLEPRPPERDPASVDQPYHHLDPADIQCPIDTQRKTDKAPGEYSLTFCALPDGRKKGPELLVYSGQGQRMYTEYLLDQEHGEHVITEADGRVMVRGRYELGRKAGLWETWYVGGGRASKGIYRADKKIDIWEEWSQDGTPKRCDYRDPAVPNMQCIEPVD